MSIQSMLGCLLGGLVAVGIVQWAVTSIPRELYPLFIAVGAAAVAFTLVFAAARSARER